MTKHISFLLCMLLLASSCAKKTAYFGFRYDTGKYHVKDKTRSKEISEPSTLRRSAIEETYRIDEKKVSKVDVAVEESNAMQQAFIPHLNKDAEQDLKAPLKEQKKELRKILKEHKKIKRSGSAVEDNLALLIVLSILLPPVAVYLVRGVSNAFWLNILLTIFFWLPGIIHALYIVLSDRE